MRIFLLLAACLAMLGCSKAPGMMTVHGKSVDHWVSALGDKDAKARRKAAEVLGNVGAVDPAVVPALIDALKDRDARVRGEAVLALLKIGPPAKDAIPALTQAAKDKDAQVRGNAAKALERMLR